MKRSSLVLLSLVIVACTAPESDSSQSGNPPGGTQTGGDSDTATPGDSGPPGDSAVAPRCADGTLVSEPCIAVVCGNDRGVGKPCTEGGGECSGTNAPFCTVDQSDTTLAFCTNFCFSDGDCGANATCVVNPENQFERGCVPNACL